MVKEDIIGGLLLAVQKGESLEQAMLSFFNAGYKREEIEMAAREVQTLPDFPAQTQKPQLQPKVSLEPSPKLKKLPQTSQVKPLNKLKPISQNIPKVIKASIDQKPIKEPSSKKPLSLSQPTPRLKDSSTPSPESQTPKPLPSVDSFPKTIPPQPVRNPLASNYGGSRTNLRSMIVWFLSILLLTLFLVLGGVFLFRDYLIEFFNNLV